MPAACRNILLAAAGLLELVAATAFVIALVHEPPRRYKARSLSSVEPSILDDVAWGSVALVLGLCGLMPLLVIVFQTGNRRRLALPARAVRRRSNPVRTIERKVEPL